MAKVKIYNALEGMSLGDLFVQDTFTIVQQTSTKLIIQDEAGARIVFSGSGFKYDAEDIPTKGTINAVTFLDADNRILVKYTDGKWPLTSDFTVGNLQNTWTIASYFNKGRDTITGSDFGDDLFAGDNPGNDVVLGLKGDDYIGGFSGNNTYDGGKGNDQLSYEQAIFNPAGVTQGVTLNATTGIVKNPWGGTDRIVSIEAFRGTNLVDDFTGSKGNERFIGYAGADDFDGRQGFDILRYDKDAQFDGNEGIIADFGAQTVKDGFGDIDTFSNIEGIEGSDFDDSFIGDGADNWFNGRDGVDTYDGNGGTDTVSFWFNNIETGVQIDMTLGSGQVIDDGYGNTETLVDIENIEGSFLADTITLGDADGISVWGDDGDDTLTSGNGFQHLGGGGGKDTFVFLAAAATGTMAGSHDSIGDFSQSDGDQIDVSAIGSFTFIGKQQFSGGSDGAELRYVQSGGKTFVIGDVDGDGSEDFAIAVDAKIKFTLDDFVL